MLIMTLDCGCTERTTVPYSVGQLVWCRRHPELLQAVVWARRLDAADDEDAEQDEDDEDQDAGDAPVENDLLGHGGNVPRAPAPATVTGPR